MIKVSVIYDKNSDARGEYVVSISGVETDRDDDETRIKIQKILEKELNKGA